jgi:hypothetical protein
VALDLPAGRIYYSQPNTKSISFANLDGSGGGDLTISGVTVNGASGIAVDPSIGRIYWANHGVISHAADAAGLARSTFYKMLRRATGQLEDDEEEPPV